MGDPLALVLLALEVAPLVRDLHAWEPVARLAEQVQASASGADGLSGREVRRARGWARRWLALPDGLRAFYARRAPQDPACGAALWLVLQGVPHRASDGLRGAARRAYQQTTGHAPPWSLMPRVP
jgi:hypothetical protein